MNGYAVVFAAIPGATAVLTWIYEHYPRLSAVAFALTAAILAVGFPRWLDALAGLTASKSGTAWLGFITAVSFICFWLEVFGVPGGKRLRKMLAPGATAAGPRPKRRYHRIRTPAIGIVFGTALVLAVGSLNRLVTGAGVSATQTSKLASTAITDIQSGKAAHAMPHQAQLIYAAVGVMVFLVLVGVAVHVERRKRGLGGKRGVPGMSGGAGRSPAAAGLPGAPGRSVLEPGKR